MNKPTASALHRPLWRKAARHLVRRKSINRLAVCVLSQFRPSALRDSVPVLNGVGVLDLHEDGDVRLYNTDQCRVAQELFWNRGRLRDAADNHALSAAIIFARRADTFLDIGAYTGLFALAAAQVNPAIRCFAYEIVPENFAALNTNIAANSLGTRIQPRLCGIGDAPNVVRVTEQMKTGQLASSIALDWTFNEGVKIPVRPLDDLHLDATGGVVMKIDVEGFEMEVLEGGRELLNRTKPDIICEVLRRARRVHEMEELLKQLGYSFYHITDNGFQLRETVTPSKQNRDWLFTSRSEDELRSLGFELRDN